MKYHCTEHPMKFDTYLEVINSSDTYNTIATFLRMHRAVVIGWTDQHGTHYDILFTPFPVEFGNLRNSTQAYQLTVSIIRVGAFCFDPLGDGITNAYVAEKFDMPPESSTTFALVELINGVMFALRASGFEA